MFLVYRTPRPRGGRSQSESQLLHGGGQVLDAQGRILIPVKLRQYAALEREVVINGASKCLELWNPERWAPIESGLVRGLSGGACPSRARAGGTGPDAAVLGKRLYFAPLSTTSCFSIRYAVANCKDKIFIF